MKIIKTLLFVFYFFIAGAIVVYAGEGSGDVTVIVNPPINGGWSAWSAQDTSCAYYTETRTQTRTCTNPAPAYGGADCVGSATQTYTVPACLATITTLSVSPTAVPYGGSASVSYYCSNGYYSRVIMDGIFDWVAYNYSLNTTVSGLTSSGSHYIMAYCYNSDWVPTTNSWLYSYYTVANEPVPGGWSAWSPQDNTCGYWTQTKTQTRTCTNPVPQYGGADCVGSATQTYTVPACSSNITAFSISPTTVPYGGTANLSYSCSNGYYSHLLLDGVWTWNDSGYFDTRTSTIPTQTTPGSHTAWAYCYNSDWVPSTNSWTIIPYTVSNAPTPAPDLKVTARSYDNADGSIEIPTGYPYTLSWSSVPNASSCTLNGSSVSVSGGTQGGTASSLSQSFTLSCTNVTGQSASDSITITTPPPVTNLTNSCSADSLTATISWTAPSGYNTFYTRATSGGVSVGYPGWDDNRVGTSVSFSISPNTSYSAWVHTKNPGNGAWSNEIYTNINCARFHTLTVNTAGTGSGTVSGGGTYSYGTVATATQSVAADSYFAGWSGDCNSSGQVTMNSNKTCTATFTKTPINGGWSAWSAQNTSCAYYAETRTQTRTCTNPAPAYGGADCVGSATQTYEVPACLSNITAFSISPTTVPYGSTANLSYYCSNGYYSHLLLDGVWTWNDSGYFDTRTSTIPAQTTPGSHTAWAYCYNSSWIPSSNSWVIIPFTVSNAPTPAPDLKVTAWGYTNADGSIETYTGSQYTISWASVPNATSCTLNGTSVSVSGGTQIGTATEAPISFTLTCTNVTGQSASDSITITTPPPPENLSSSCSADAMTATLNWTAPSGYNTFYTRATRDSDGVFVLYDDGKVGTSQSFAISPNTGYSAWIHTRTPSNGAWSWSISTNINCTRNHTLTVNTAGNGSGTVSGGGTYNYGTVATATQSANTGSTFAGWSGDCDSNGQVTMNSNKTCTATFTAVTASVVASPTSYNTIPNTNVSFSYTPSTSLGSTECRLLNNVSSPLTAFQASSPIVYTPPSSAGAYGYYVQCRNTVHTTVTATSSLITVTVVTVSVSATTPYNVVPGASVPFAYTATTNTGSTECMLLDNAQTAVTSYQSTSPISYTVPNSPGSYGYYVKCRNTGTTTAMATSGLITVNTTCASGTSWNGTACVLPSGTITASNCSISSGGSSCPTTLVWNTFNPIGTSQVTTPTNIIVANTDSSPGTDYTIDYGSRTFYLYNNGEPPRAQATATATCASGTVWNATSGKCEPPTGNLVATGCTIAVGGNSCATTLTWDTVNPITGVTSILKDSTNNVTIATANSGSQSYSLTPGVREFKLWHNGVSIYTASATAVCAPKTTWNGSSCMLNEPRIDSFRAEPSTIFKGKSATLIWSSDPDLVNSCVGTGFDTGNLISGSATVSPLETTNYTLVCSRDALSISQSAAVKVITLIIKEQ